MSVCCECCVLSGRGLCDGLITRLGDSYRLWRVVVCDQETSNKEAKACYGAVENTTKRVVTPIKQINNINVSYLKAPIHLQSVWCKMIQEDEKGRHWFGQRLYCTIQNFVLIFAWKQLYS